MGITAAIRNVFTPSPSLSPAEAQRLDAFDRRRKLTAKADDIGRRKKAAADELATLAALETAAAAAQTAVNNAMVAEALGQPLQTPLTALREAAETARKAAADGRQRAIVLQGVLAAYDEQSRPLHDALLAIRRELLDLVPVILSERLVAGKPATDAALAAAQGALDAQEVIIRAHDEFAVAMATGTFWKAQAYIEHRWPTPDHPAFKPQHADVFAAGAALREERDALTAKQAMKADAVQALLRELVDGG